MDGLDISTLDRVDDRIFRCPNSSLGDYDEDTYQSALSDCNDLACDSAISENEEESELNHKTKKLKVMVDEEKEGLKSDHIPPDTQAHNDDSPSNPDSKLSGGEIREESKLVDETLKLTEKESQKTQQSDDSNYGSTKTESHKSFDQTKAEELKSSHSPQVVNNRNQDGLDECKSPQTLYQRFIQSNSVSLSKSPKFEALQCPYCIHGFVNFSALETHVIFCKKKKEVAL